MSKPRALDLFCCSGGASMGLHQAGFDVTGVDIEPQPRYPFTFMQTDAISFMQDGDLHKWDLIWASPPCQRYSCVTPKAHRSNHPDLIGKTRDELTKLGKPYIIENVVGAPLQIPLMLCGSMFGLRTRRHRIFETSFSWFVPGKCDHRERPLLVTTAGANSRKIGNTKTVRNAPLAYGIDWMNGAGLREAIPPAYSKYIGEFAIKHIRAATTETLIEGRDPAKSAPCNTTA